MDWSDLDRHMIDKITGILLEHQDDPFVGKAKVLAYILKIRPSQIQLIADDQLADLLDLISWAKLDGNTIQLYQNFRPGLTLPHDLFSDGTCYEYAKADEHLGRYLQNNDPKDLDLFFATLVRHKGQTSTTDKQIEKKVKKIKGVTPKIKLVTACYFLSVKKYVYTTFERWLFDGDPPRPGSVNLGWWGAFMRIAQMGVFGNLEKVHETFFFDVLAYMIQQKEDVETIKYQQKKTAP